MEIQLVKFKIKTLNKIHGKMLHGSENTE